MTVPALHLNAADIAELTNWRQQLHRFPDLSGNERDTARRVVEMLRHTAPDDIVTDLGGHGVAAVFNGHRPGPGVMVRCELDGLPIAEVSDRPYRSSIAGQGHLCGHDGHMAVLMGVARALGRKRPARGRAILLFQPAEENGAGAAAVIADRKFAALRPDIALSLHNMPGMPLGHAALAVGVMNCASRGMRIELGGRTAHASDPATGLSPMAALSRLMPAMTGLARGDGPRDAGFALVTITHARLGEAAFGVAPGQAELWATLRTRVDADMADLVARAETMVREAAGTSGLSLAIGYHDIFRHCENHPEATAILAAALDGEGIAHDTRGLPMRASEDFGRFGDVARSAMFLLGAGETCASLHNPDYDFPDALIPVGARVFLRALDNVLNRDSASGTGAV